MRGRMTQVWVIIYCDKRERDNINRDKNALRKIYFDLFSTIIINIIHKSLYLPIISMSLNTGIDVFLSLT